MENLWTPLFSLTVFLIVFAVGDVVSYKTKGLISGIIIAAVVLLFMATRKVASMA